ncbi:hypothetical protein AC792_10090 [Arthrobacter sp. RIT-PI-e]|uniref:ABC transporter substrate-binding protein n=1 Tax=Arthrobacter sp. RIT-PI-e TaxID=1681197 RepID=UPI000675D76A|nr:extracellular solute-binding protein [Arthrobacter sp. RIT-PI-e]KNC18804.1 hypothetical protein AC792_10090 [Arthrobacter sp. RIT-PI-e]
MTTFSGTRKHLGLAAIALVAGLGLTACGGGDGGSQAGGDGNIRFTWWGSDPRHEANERLIDMFESDHDGITIAGEYTDFGGYWDRLATTTAGGSAPDVITMDEKYLQEYAGRGALVDLTQLDALDLSAFDDAALDLGSYDGGVYGLTTGQNAYVVMINEDLLEQAGLELPDDTTWTWDDYYELSAALDEALGDGVRGTEFGAQDVDLRIWLRQQGESLYNEAEGTVGYTPEAVTSWFEHLLAVRDDGGGQTASEFAEDASGTFEAGAMPTNRVAMGWYWSNQLSALRTASDANISMLRVPSESGEANDNGMYFKASMYWSISDQTNNQDAAAEFVNFLANDPEAAKVMLVDRGVPVNPAMAEAVTPELNEAEQTVVSFLDEIAPDIDSTELPSPVGTGGVQDVVGRYVSQVLFGSLTPEQATTQMTDEINGMIRS